MQAKQPSDFDLTVQRTLSLFRDTQNDLCDTKDSPLTFSSEQPQLDMWISSKWIKPLFNVFCIPIDFRLDTEIRPEDLEEFNFSFGDCKVEHGHGDEARLAKLEWLHGKAPGSLESNSSVKLESHSSGHNRHDDNDTSFHDEYGSRGKRDYKRGPYKNYTVEEKMAAVKMLLEDHHSVIEVSRRLRIPCKNIKRWSQYGVERKKGGGRKRFSPETQKKVARKLKDLYKEGAQVEYEKVQDIARALSDDPTFKASRGWVVKFVQRQNLRSYYRFV